MPYTFDNADTLVYSDDPEALATQLDPANPAIHVATPKNAILYEAQVGSGVKRIFYYHQNFDADPRTIGVRLVNLSATAVSLNIIPYVEPPAGDVISVGHRSVVGFLKALIAAEWSAKTLQATRQAGDDAIVAISSPGGGELASAFVEVEIPQGAQIKVQVVCGDRQDALAEVGRNGPSAQHDGIGRSGVYDLTRGGTTQGDSGAITWATGESPVHIDVPSKVPFPNSKPAPVAPGRNPARAVYGVFTRRTITFTNPTSAPVEASVSVQACGGGTPATCMLNDDIVELGTMQSGAPATRPGYELGRFTIAPRDSGSLTIDLLGTVDPSGLGPLSLVIGQAGTLPQPPPGQQIVFRPGGPSWQA